MKLRNMNIGRRLLLLVLSGSMLVFLLLGGACFYGMFEARDVLANQGEKLGQLAADNTSDFVETQMKRRLATMTRLHARKTELDLNQVKEHVANIADHMHRILSSHETYRMRQLPDPRYQVIRSGEPYVHYGPQLQKDGIGDLAAEIGTASNIKDTLIPLGKLYSKYPASFFVGSENGYLICMDIAPAGDHVVKMTEEFLTAYDPRERPWYRLAEQAEAPVFTDVYVGADGYPCITCAVPYRDADGFAGVAAISESLEAVCQMLEDTSLGETEESVIMDCSTGRILLSSREEGSLSALGETQDLRKSDAPELMEVARQMTDGKSEILEVPVDGTDYYLAFAPMKSLGWSYGILIEKSEILAPGQMARRNILAQIDEFQQMAGSMFLQFAVGAAFLFLMLFALLFYGSIKVSDRFAEPIRQLSDGVKEIAQGNLDKKLDIRTGDEIEHLSVCFNAMTLALKEHMRNLTEITSEKERIATELNVAKNIQAGMLPNVFPPFPDRTEFDIYATMQPAKEVGGDFYDFYLVDENHLIVTMADVSGKGVPAALFMMISKTVLKNFATMMAEADNLSEVMNHANNQLCQNNEEGMFVTTFLGMLDLKTGEFRYVNGGHNPPLVGRSKGDGRTFEYLALKKGCALGIMEDRSFSQTSLTLALGDMLFLYTDGVTEAMDSENRLYTEERLKLTLDQTTAEATAEEVLEFVKKDIRAHARDAEQSDDITMLGLVYRG